MKSKINKSYKSIIVGTILSSNIMLAFAAESPFSKDGIFYKLFSDLNGLISGAVIGLLIGVAIALFFWSLVTGMWRVGQGGDAIKKNKDVLIWGIGILFVMVSIWGIIKFLQDGLGGRGANGYGNVRTIDLPTIPGNCAYNNSCGAGAPVSNPNNPSAPRLKANGQTCGAPAECQTGNCAFDSVSGSLRCQSDGGSTIGL